MKELPNTVVHTKTQEEYDELMKLYEEAGWRWVGGDKPTAGNWWSVDEDQTCVWVSDRFIHSPKNHVKNNGLKIISLAELKQGLGGEFKVGDRVKTDFGLGEIVYMGGCEEPYLVKHDDWHEGHCGAGYSDKSYGTDECWWFNKEDLERVPKTVSCSSSSDILTAEDIRNALKTPMSTTPSPYISTYSVGAFIPIINNKGGLMSKLRSIPKKVKRMLNPNYRAFYQLGWVCEDLTLNSEGSNNLEEFLLDKFEAEFGKHAQAEVKRIKKEVK